MKRKTVNVPEWGGKVLVQELSAEALEALAGKDLPVMAYRAHLVALCVVDEGGAPLFSVEDVEGLLGGSGKALTRVSSVAMRMNRITERELEEAEENFT